MHIVDFVVLVLILVGALLGYKRGFTKSLVCFLLLILVIALAFLLKNPLSVYFYQHLPFFKFGGYIKGLTILNILLYEFLAIVILIVLFKIILRIALLATTMFEKILNATVILSIPSKILGIIVGAVEYYVIAFVALYVLSLPFFNFDFMEESKYSDKILNNTPLISPLITDSNKAIQEFASIKETYKNSEDVTEFNYKTLDIFLKYKIVTVESIDELNKRGKLNIDNVETVLVCYRKNIDDQFKQHCNKE